jgi:hypothetical protein
VDILRQTATRSTSTRSRFERVLVASLACLERDGVPRDPEALTTEAQ